MGHDIMRFNGDMYVSARDFQISNELHQITRPYIERETLRHCLNERKLLELLSETCSIL